MDIDLSSNQHSMSHCVYFLCVCLEARLNVPTALIDCKNLSISYREHHLIPIAETHKKSVVEGRDRSAVMEEDVTVKLFV